MAQQRLSNFVLHVHKKRTIDLSMVEICNVFVADSEIRIRFWAKLSDVLQQDYYYLFSLLKHLVIKLKRLVHSHSFNINYKRQRFSSF